MAFDRRHGGFGDAPKFPRPSELLFLLREHARRDGRATAAQAPLLMATDTLRAMALGGMRDHIGGGFHRYSVDAEWRVPHFEKMLYDQAQLVLAYLEAAQATGDDFYATVAEDTLDYVLRDLTDPRRRVLLGGGRRQRAAGAARRSAARTSREGAFYIWTDAEIGALLGDDAAIVRRRFGIEPDGNAPQIRRASSRGKNLLYIAQSIDDIATRDGPDAGRSRRRARRASRADALRGAGDAAAAAPRRQGPDRLERPDDCRVRARSARARRTVRPRHAIWLPRDARGRSSGRRCGRRDGRLLRRYRDGEAAIDAYAEDYAYLIFGLLELFQADGDPRVARVGDDASGRAGRALLGRRRTAAGSARPGSDPTVLLRLKEDYDGAEPAPARSSC